MNSSHFSNLLKQLLSEHNIVALPGMGYFEMKDIPSEIINNGTAITPPCRKIVFESSSECVNNLLAEAYANEKGIGVKEAEAEVAEFLKEFKKRLINKGEAEIPYFGSVCYGEAGSFVFKADPIFDVEADSYCLETISLKVNSELNGGEAILVENSAEDPLESSGSEVVGMESFDIELVDEQAIELESESAVEPVIESVEENESESAVEPESVPAEENESELVVEPESVPAEENESELAVEPESVPAVEPEVVPVVQEVVENGSEVAPVAEETVKESDKQKQVNKVLIAIGVVVAVLVVCIILLFVFKDQLMPILEKLLYSPEELEVLRQHSEQTM